MLKMKILPSEIAGWAGIVLIQGATIPLTLGNILGYTKQLPPLSMVLMVWAGLGLFLWRSIEHKDRLSIVSNSVGFTLNSLLLAIIVYPHIQLGIAQAQPRLYFRLYMIMVRKDSFKYIKKRLDKAGRGPKAPIFNLCQPLKCIFILFILQPIRANGADFTACRKPCQQRKFFKQVNLFVLQFVGF